MTDSFLIGGVPVENMLAYLKTEAEQQHARAEKAQAERDTLKAAIEQFMAKWPAAEKGIQGAIVIATIHGCPYSGPTLDDELNAFRAALAACVPPQETEK